MCYCVLEVGPFLMPEYERVSRRRLKLPGNDDVVRSWLFSGDSMIYWELVC